MADVRQLVDYTRDDYHERRHADLLESPELREAWSHFAQLAYFSDLGPGSRVLELGGGLGNNLLQLRGHADILMVEPSGAGRAVAAEHGITSVASIDEAGTGFDRILCRHVLEHLPEPRATLCALRDRLAPRGRLVLVLPCEPPTTLPSDDDIDHHLYCWNPRTLSNLVRTCDLTPTRTRFEHYGGRRRLLPLYRSLGGRAYAHAVRAVGRVFRFREFIVEAARS